MADDLIDLKKRKKTFFDSACNAGHLDIVELLIKYKANVNIQSTSGNTALHYAAGGVSPMV